MHVHIGLPEFLAFCAYYVIFNFFARQVAARYADSAFGQALAYIVA